MLKWTVVNKRDHHHHNIDDERRPSLGCQNIDQKTSHLNNNNHINSTGSKGKRRRSRTSRRRSSHGRIESTGQCNETSLCLDLQNKENQYTSTPIKNTVDECFQTQLTTDALRDVSNVTSPIRKKVCRRQLYTPPAVTKKKKQQCVDPQAHQSQDFLLDLDSFRPFESVDSHIEGYVPLACHCKGKVFAPMKLDHVNDFLQQISYITSPEDPTFTYKEVAVSPLVKKLVDLRFNQQQQQKLNESSLINELSLDKIVDAILDNTVKENEVNETHEENLLNEKQNASIDSGFKSDLSCKLMTNKTIINMDGTYNERCVDVNDGLSRKRPAADDDQHPTGGKKFLLDSFTLKRQKCIRRRKIDENNKKSDDYSFSETYIVDTPEVVNRRLSFDEESDTNTFIINKSPGRGSIDLEIELKDDKLLVNVFRCTNLRRNNLQPINAYVKVGLSDIPGRKQKDTLQRTPVQAESSNPTFNHIFNVPITSIFDLQKKILHVEVWHRERTTRRSEFLGCVSLHIKNAIKKNINGSYRLLPQSGRCPTTITPIPIEQIEDTKASSDTMCETHQVDDVLQNCGLMDETSLSQQQKDADENLFLRYLELDPTEGPEAAPAAAQRRATGNKNIGRTPFTTTKLLKKQPKMGFGFSVVWTHPPRIEKVEKGLPADIAGIQRGDYLIFVDTNNVVMMPEIEILNLIKSFGNQLTLEIFRRNAQRNGSVPSVRPLINFETSSSTGLPPAPPSTVTTQRRPSTVCSTNTTSMEYNRKKLHLPQVTFSSERPVNSVDDTRKKAMYQIITKEQQYAISLQFSIARYVAALVERKDLINPQEHRILFQNIDELLRITEDILEHVVTEDGDYQANFLLRAYQSKLSELTMAYKKYCVGIKKADCVLANLLKNDDFGQFLTTPAIPRRRPDITTFIHKPLEHYREILKLFNILLSYTKPNYDDYILINQIIHDLQISYREITSEAGLMEPPIGDGRPLLSVQDLENRLVFTKCKPFVLTKPGRQWIFGGDLSRVEGRNIRQYWGLLFTDILLFAKVSRDRVLFILEEPLSLLHITDFFFNVRKKANEFRIIIEPGGVPGGMKASSPTVHCGPELTRTPRKNPLKRCIVLRTPTVELKAVWQNLLQRQIFHVNAGMDGSSYSSPLESPEAPITSSVVTLLQSAESLSLRRQTNVTRNINTLLNEQLQQQQQQQQQQQHQKHINELIEHKCKQMEKCSASSKSNAIHLEQWMKGQYGSVVLPQEPEELEVWSQDMIRKRSQELNLINFDNNNAMPTTITNDNYYHHHHHHIQQKTDELQNSSDENDQSPSKSTNTTESQVTVRSSPLVPETVQVCKKCHKTCISNNNRTNNNNNNNDNKSINEDDDHDDWRPLMLMGLSALNPAASLVKCDPFTMPLPKISVLPPTPELQMSLQSDLITLSNGNCNCHTNNTRPQVTELILNKDYDNSPDDSPLNDEQPYHSLNSSNLTLRRFGTVSSLERVGSDEQDDQDSYDACLEEDPVENTKSTDNLINKDGIEDPNSTILSWTARAGSFVAEKMAFFERLGEDYRSTSKFFEKYLKNEIIINGDEVQEEETSGATSGEEIWGTPTSGGGEIDDPLSSPNYDGHNSPNSGGDSLSSNEDTELMMDELLMTPPVTSSNIRGLLPRRTLEPLMEEEYSDTCTTSGSASSSSLASSPTEHSISPEQGNETGDAADKCLVAAAPAQDDLKPSEGEDGESNIKPGERTVMMIHRSESYQRIIEQEEDNLGFFTRFRNRPSMKFLNIEHVPPSRGVKFLEFFNKRKIHETFPTGKHLIKVFSREGEDSDEVPTSYSDRPEALRRIKDRQLDRRFWRQLSKRRSNKPVQLSA